MIASLLARWNAKRPEECKRHGNFFGIGEYSFRPLDGGLLAYADDCTGEARGNAALDWLRGSVERAIEAAGLPYETSFWVYSNQPRYRVYWVISKEQAIADNSTVALLQSYVEYLEGQE